MIIAVIGNYDPPLHVYALAEGVGKELAQCGVLQSSNRRQRRHPAVKSQGIHPHPRVTVGD